jgi:hypothetical protein
MWSSICRFVRFCPACGTLVGEVPFLAAISGYDQIKRSPALENRIEALFAALEERGPDATLECPRCGWAGRI